MPAKTRFLKWVGMPPVLQSDGWRVANWKYENRRPIAMTLPPGHKGGTTRIIEKGTHEDHEGNRVSVSREYIFRQRNDGFVTEVAFTDAMAIMTVAPFEFVDVTDMPRSQWHKVRNTPIIMPETEKSSSAAQQQHLAR